MKEVKLGKSHANEVIKAIDKESGFRLPLPLREKRHIGVSAYSAPSDGQKELWNALLEAEKQKAKHVIEIQRRSSIR